jgi:RNA polymerase sigma factor (sigma-70 family)
MIEIQSIMVQDMRNVRRRVRFPASLKVFTHRKRSAAFAWRERQGMANHQPPLTRLTLLGALAQGLRWEEFLALYGRLILAWGRQEFGLQETDAENLRQEVLIRVWKSLRSYDPARGRFRSWLFACTRNAVFDLRKDGLGGAPSGDCLPAASSRNVTPAERWREAGDLEKALHVLEEDGFAPEGLQHAVAKVRARVQPATWKAFLLFEFFDLRAKEIADRLHLTPAAVNQAVHRVRELLQQAVSSRQPTLPPHQGRCS